MTETYDDIPQRVSTLCSITLAATVLPSTTLTLARLGTLSSAFDAFRNELNDNLEISLPDAYLAQWAELETIHALHLASAQQLSDEVQQEIRAIVSALREQVEASAALEGAGPDGESIPLEATGGGPSV